MAICWRARKRRWRARRDSNRRTFDKRSSSAARSTASSCHAPTATTVASPKAKVTGSNPVGRANLINQLCEVSEKRPKVRLTTNSPIKSRHWRVIGGLCAQEADIDRLDQRRNLQGRIASSENVTRRVALAQLAQFDLERGSQFVAAALIDQGLEWLRQSVFGV